MEEKTNKNERFLHRYDTVFAFLGLECIALILFGFGGSLGSMILKFLALFLAFAKRRDDVVMYEGTGIAMRKNVNRYNLAFMNQAIGLIASVTMVSYIMYSVSEEVTRRMGSDYLYLTSFFVLMGILRYMQLTIVDVKSGSPTRVLLHDRFIQVCLLCWIAVFFFIIYC